MYRIASAVIEAYKRHRITVAFTKRALTGNVKTNKPTKYLLAAIIE